MALKDGSAPLPKALEALLGDAPGDEKTGANATLGFTFQQWWGALVIAELLEFEADFAVGMEVKEDVAILDSALSPMSVEFCQIKKNEQAGGWGLKDLHRQGPKRKSKPHDPSILAKLHKRRTEFAGHPAKLRFVSNLAVKIAAGMSASDCQLTSLTPAEQAEIREKVAKQLAVGPAEVDLNDWMLHRTNLPLGEQYLFLAGKLAALSAAGKIPFDLPNPTVATRYLASVLQSKASHTSYAATIHDLKSRVLSRADAIQALSEAAGTTHRASERLDDALQQLAAAGYPFLALKQIKAERTTPAETGSDVADQVYEATTQALASAFAQRDTAALEKAAEILHRGRRIFCFGVGGSSANVALEAENRFFRLDMAVSATADSYKHRVIASTVDPQDVLLIFSVTGRPRSLVDGAEIATSLGASVIAVTDPSSPLAARASVVVPLIAFDEEKFFYMPNRGRYGQLFVLDCLATLVGAWRRNTVGKKLWRARSNLVSLHGTTDSQPVGD